MNKTYIILMIVILSISCKKKQTDLKLLSKQNFERIIDSTKVYLFTPGYINKPKYIILIKYLQKNLIPKNTI